MEHLAGLVDGEWALWRCVGVRAPGFPVSGLDAFGGEGERAALAAVAADPRFREAVLWQNPAALRNAVDKVATGSPASGSTQRRRLEMVASYWQRYCAKNDTIGFFGPMGWAEFVDEGPAIATARPGRDLVAARTVRFEVWVIEALGKALGADCVVPLCPHPERELRLHLERSGDAAGLIALDELEAARDKVAAAAGDETALAGAIAALDEVFERLTGQAPVHQPGVVYGARTVVYHDCRRDLELTFGPPMREALAEGLVPLLASARWYCGEVAAVARDVIREAVAAVRARMGVPDGPIPLGPVFGMVAPQLIAIPPGIGTVVEELQRRWAELIAGGVNGLADRARELFADAKPGWRWAAHHAPDVQVAAASVKAIRDGDFQLVFGDFHPGIVTLAQAMFHYQHPDPPSIQAWLAADIPPPRIWPAGDRRLPRQTGRVVPHVAVPGDVTVVFNPDDAGIQGERTLGIADLVVDGDEVVWDGSVRQPLLEAFALMAFVAGVRSWDPFPHDLHAPRLTLGRSVLRRETWWVDAAQVPPAAGMAAWAAGLGMPRRVFVLAPPEQKPFMIDFESPLLVGILGRMLRRTVEAGCTGPAVRFTEMLPAPEQCWLPDADGNTYASEFRLTALDIARPGG